MSNKKLFIFIVVSFLVHFLLLYILPNTAFVTNKIQNNENLVFLENIQTKNNLFNGQIVDLLDDEKTKNITPKDTKYLSDKDRSVEKETKAKFSQNKPLEAILAQPMQGIQGEKKGEKKKKPLKSEEGISYEQAGKDKKGGIGGTAGSRFQLPYDPNITDADEGALTRLNTKYFLYSSYFTRIKRQISTSWEPKPAFDRIYELNPAGPPTNMITTVVQLTLDKSGNLISIFVKNSSGFAVWDNESIRSVKSAAPFLNPPKELFNEAGQLTFDFSFVGEMSVNFFYKTIR